jgi:hypothetical protein
MLVTEPLLLVLALAQGWGRQKIGAWSWIIRNRHRVWARRRRVQSEAVTPSALVANLSSRISTTVMAPPGMALLNELFAAYWRLVWPSKAIRVGGLS